MSSDENATDLTQSVCPFNWCNCAPVEASQIHIDLSHEPETILAPLYENATDFTL